ncbi:MAG: hypothetical protein E7649_07570 [Ruminococcaceae bacterium]|nr:hypothetical protein [Oscillospiraceae bacterium]
MDSRKLLELNCGDVVDGGGDIFTPDGMLVISKDNVVIKNLVIKGEVRVESDNVTIDGCTVGSVFVSGKAFVAQNNKILGDVVLSGAVNALVARNEVSGIVVGGAFNCSVVLNTASTIMATENTNVYVIDNTVISKLGLYQNNYLIADGNKYGELCVDENENINGNTVTDVDFRPEVGANEDILPHTNKELFVGMERRETVANTGLTFQQYLDACAENANGAIIVPPGVYSVDGTVKVTAIHSNTTIYAYGVYQEYTETDHKKYKVPLLSITKAQNTNVFGLTMGQVLPTCGQIRIIKKYIEKDAEGNDQYKLLVATDAGFIDGFTKTDPDRYHTWWPETFINDENGKVKLYCDENPMGNHEIVRNYDENGNYDGTMTMTLTGKNPYRYCSSKEAVHVWNRLAPGNIMTCRMSYGPGGSLYLGDAVNVKIRDTVMYGHAGALSTLAGGMCEGVCFERHHNCIHSESIIDKETYDKYKAFEEKYGVDFEVREETVDGNVRYRGPFPRSGSIDAFHISGTKQGVNITSSLLESMVDDGSNQHAASGRLHAYKDNGDGTTTFFYKPAIGGVQWGHSTWVNDESHLNTMLCAPFVAGDRIYVYTPFGKTVCDTTVLTGTKNEGTVDIDLTYGNVHKHAAKDLYSVTLKTEDIDFDAFISPATGKEFDLSDNRYEIDNRLTVDNLSRNCSDYTIDNVMVRDGHSRGFLIKVVGATIKHCTFRNVSYNGLLIRPETEWVESTVSRNINIHKCLFDHTGYIFESGTEIAQSCIRIQSTSKVVSNDTLPIDNISITGCKFTNNEQRTAIWINSAKNVTVKDNTFDPIVKNVHRPEVLGTAVLLDTCLNVDISGNTYNLEQFNGDVKNVIKGSNYANIHGSDVTHTDGSPIFPDDIKA